MYKNQLKNTTCPKKIFEGFNYFSFFSNESFNLIDNRPDGLSLDRYIVSLA